MQPRGANQILVPIDCHACRTLGLNQQAPAAIDFVVLPQLMWLVIIRTGLDPVAQRATTGPVYADAGARRSRRHAQVEYSTTAAKLIAGKTNECMYRTSPVT
jgi:hypothetical protein